MRKYNWLEIQTYYNAGHSERECTDYFGVTTTTLHRAKKRGDFLARNRVHALHLHTKLHGRKKHTQETKDKLSKIRTEYLIKNPHQIPYRINHSSKESYPEKLFRLQLEKVFPQRKYNWVQEYQNGIYSYDFAFPDIKLDIEIDGSLHKTEKISAIDKKRDIFSTKNGWVVIRLDSKLIKKDINKCILFVFFFVSLLKQFSFQKSL